MLTVAKPKNNKVHASVEFMSVLTSSSEIVDCTVQHTYPAAWLQPFSHNPISRGVRGGTGITNLKHGHNA